MRWNWITLFAYTAHVYAHGAHHAGEDSFSQERLDELEKKWGTDVSCACNHARIQLMLFSGASLVFRPLLIYLTHGA